MAEWCGLNERAVDWVQTAQAGDAELGYSEALLCVDGEGDVPLRVLAAPVEREQING